MQDYQQDDRWLRDTASLLGDQDILEQLNKPRVMTVIPKNLVESLQQKIPFLRKHRPEMGKPGERTAESTANSRKREKLFS